MPSGHTKISPITYNKWVKLNIKLKIAHVWSWVIRISIYYSIYSLEHDKILYVNVRKCTYKCVEMTEWWQIYVQTLIKVWKWQNGENVRTNSYKCVEITEWWQIYVQTLIKVWKWQNGENVRTNSLYDKMAKCWLIIEPSRH